MIHQENPQPHPPTSSGGWRSFVSLLLIVVFALSLALSVATVWARVQVMNTDAFVRTVSPLARDPVIQRAVATQLTNLIAGELGIDPTTEPGSGIRDASRRRVLDTIDRTVLAIVQSDAFHQQWDNTFELAHRRAIDAYVADDNTGPSIHNGEFALDLTPILISVQDQLRDAGIEAVDRLTVDPNVARFVMIRTDLLVTLQRYLELIEWLAVLFPIITISTLISLVIAMSGLWSVILRIGIATVVSMAMLAVAIPIARSLVMRSLLPDTDHDAARALLDILLRGLWITIGVVAITGGVLWVAGWIGGRRAEAGRHDS